MTRTRTARRLPIALLLALTAAAPACDLITGPSDQEELDAAWERWLNRGPLTYQYDYIMSCFCGWPGTNAWVRIVVDRDVVLDAWYLSSGEPIPTEFLAGLPVIEDLFTRADDVIHHADEYRIEYDRELGFPRLMDVDWQKNAIDDESTARADHLIEIALPLTQRVNPGG